MHYIRLLRPAAIDPKTNSLSLLFTLTTDLGDTFLAPEAPFELRVVVEDGDRSYEFNRSSDSKPIIWHDGLRVLDLKLQVNRRLTWQESMVHIYTQFQSGPLRIRTAEVLPWNAKSPMLRKGLVMPVSMCIRNRAGDSVCTRSLQIDTGRQDLSHFHLEFEEDIGESITRHIWDAGVVMAAYVSDTCRSNEVAEILPLDSEDVHILELGSGVGILGITMAGIIWRAAAGQSKNLREASVLLTDLPEAEERARSNIARAQSSLSSRPSFEPRTTISYENLDWYDAKDGNFGPLASAQPWSFVVLSDCTYNVDSLPALVGTLNALDKMVQNHPTRKTENEARMRVLLATKPRHASEKKLFDLLDADDWMVLLLKTIPLPVIGSDSEVVEIYSLQKI